MRHIRTAVEKNQDQSLLTRFEDLSKFIMKNNRLSTTDLPEFVGQPIKFVFIFSFHSKLTFIFSRRGPPRQQQGIVNNIRKGFQRFTNTFVRLTSNKTQNQPLIFRFSSVIIKIHSTTNDDHHRMIIINV